MLFLLTDLKNSIQTVCPTCVSFAVSQVSCFKSNAFDHVLDRLLFLVDMADVIETMVANNSIFPLLWTSKRGWISINRNFY